MNRAVIGRVVACLMVLTACGDSAKKPSDPQAQAVKVKPVLQGAVLVGSVRLQGGMELPKYTPDELERRVLTQVKAGAFPPVCSPSKPDDFTPVRLTPDGKLIGVLLAASEFSHHEDPPPAKVRTLEIKDCRLDPRLLVARIGDTLRIHNATDFPMLPGVGAETFNQAVVSGASRELKLDTGGIKSVMCGFSAPCGRTDVVVLAHPYAAATDEHGEFRIENFPPDETIRINAWHPLFHEATLSVRVQRGEEKRVELVLSPKVADAPKPEAPKTDDGYVSSPD